MSNVRPTMKELREFARLPWVRCVECNRVTGRLQDKYDAILADKEKDYYDNIQDIYQTLLDQGFDDLTAQRLANQQAEIIASVKFNKRVQTELGIKDECCFKTLQSPIILPLGSGIELDPEVDVGQRMSKLQIKEAPSPVLPSAKGKSIATPQTKRVYRAI